LQRWRTSAAAWLSCARTLNVGHRRVLCCMHSLRRFCPLRLFLDRRRLEHLIKIEQAPTTTTRDDHEPSLLSGAAAQPIDHDLRSSSTEYPSAVDPALPEDDFASHFTVPFGREPAYPPVSAAHNSINSSAPPHHFAFNSNFPAIPHGQGAYMDIDPVAMWSTVPPGFQYAFVHISLRSFSQG
jgi:hypothetical protein